MMIANWQSLGIGMWKETETTLTLVAAQASYSLGPSGATTSPVLAAAPNAIVEARFVYAAGNERSINEISLSEYKSLSDKTSAGKPTQYYLKKGIGNSTMYLWPVPDSASDTVKFTARLAIQDIGEYDDNPDFPSEWFRALKWNLVSELAPHYKEYYINDKTFGKIESRAKQTLQDLIDLDRESTSVYFEAE
jgi:hypothetical protein